MAWRRALRAGGAVGLAALLVGWFPTAASAATAGFTITDPRITELSGMARDPQANLYWAVNDSGDTGVVYGVTGKGEVRGTLDFREDPKDVEAVAVHANRLYVADIGDNDAKRKTIRVYYFDNPRASGLSVSYRAWDFRYPDGPHNAETLLVTETGRLYVVTKEASGGFYRAPAKPSRKGTNRLTKVNDAPPLVTDGVVLPGGKQIALLSYTQVSVVDAKTGDPVASTPLKGIRQAESLTLSLDGTSLLVGTEGKRPKIVAVPIPGAAASVSPSAAPSDSGADDDPADEPTTPLPAQKGTWLAVGLAAVVAVVAGVVVGVVRRP
jgi:hypothetical protein